LKFLPLTDFEQIITAKILFHKAAAWVKYFRNVFQNKARLENGCPAFCLLLRLILRRNFQLIMIVETRAVFLGWSIAKDYQMHAVRHISSLDRRIQSNKSAGPAGRTNGLTTKMGLPIEHNRGSGGRGGGE